MKKMLTTYICYITHENLLDYLFKKNKQQKTKSAIKKSF
ncbi:hypothetical protein CLV62_10855 [Dysgonomonas alginatilytica]|uniref:Uncharacterized protein n=1 Tax=Dysgonomonas alginatilytica TaxID=1605892 RepID=A0A2V3PSB2_9BACT|nr:hypothetical protein CLV62_10855 [Dysgonomonas alginatilytica]